MPDNKLSVTPEYVETYKFDKWVQYFTDPDYVHNGRKTFGNATQSTLAAYGPMPYGSAASIGSDNFKKIKHMGRAVFEKMKDDKGNPMGFKNVLTLLYNKMQKSDNPGWFDRFNRAVGYVDEEPKQGTGFAVKTEDKNGNITEIKVVSFDQLKPEDQ